MGGYIINHEIQIKLKEYDFKNRNKKKYKKILFKI